jgi:hypothetical protein
MEQARRSTVESTKNMNVNKGRILEEQKANVVVISQTHYCECPRRRDNRWVVRL